MKKILIVDDIRDAHNVLHGTEYGKNSALGFDPQDLIIVARTYSAAMHVLNTNVEWDCLFLDHDLALINNDAKTGYDFICEIEKRFHESKDFKLPKNMICISSNPPGKMRIEECWNQIKKAVK